MNKQRLFGLALLAGASTLVPRDAAAWFQRSPPQVCQGPIEGGNGSPEPIVDNRVFCPLLETDTMLDSHVTLVNVDFMGNANTSKAEVSVCIFTNWVSTCGGTTPGTVPSSGHLSIQVTDLSLWQNDSSHGYAVINILPTGDNTMELGGVFIQGT